jgi:hypothetical protein
LSNRAAGIDYQISPIEQKMGIMGLLFTFARTLVSVFPGYTGYPPMGIFKSIPEPDDLIFRGGFES